MGFVNLVCTPNEFLEYVHQHVRLVGRKIEPIPHDEQRQQLMVRFRFTFTLDLDLVIEGECAAVEPRQATLQFPIGMYAPGKSKGNKPYVSWLHEVVREKNAYRVLLFPKCCGPYNRQYQDLLQRALPEVTLYIPDVYDLHDNIHAHLNRLCRNLTDAGIMKIPEPPKSPTKLPTLHCVS